MLSGRNATERAGHAYDRALSERVKRDLWYINNWSLWLDIKY
jgi:lipopolysaccharide/colanic/teichoic acid biosynthesis glycosyltransferase